MMSHFSASLDMPKYSPSISVMFVGQLSQPLRSDLAVQEGHILHYAMIKGYHDGLLPRLSLWNNTGDQLTVVALQGHYCFYEWTYTLKLPSREPWTEMEIAYGVIVFFSTP